MNVLVKFKGTQEEIDRAIDIMDRYTFDIEGFNWEIV